MKQKIKNLVADIAIKYHEKHIINGRYKKLIADDKILYQSLESDEKRVKYWQTLWNETLRSDLISVFEDCKFISGSVIECGVWRGRTTKLICRSLKELEKNKTFYACDSFEGFGETTLSSEDEKLFRPLSLLKKKFTSASDVPDNLKKFFGYYGIDGVCLKGFFHETLEQIAQNETFCFAHIDCDAYKPHLECLNYIYPRLSKGGCIVFDDYGSKIWPGTKKAVDEFFSNKPEKIKYKKERGNGAWFIQKA